MTKIISMQDIRQSLASIANQAQAGTAFVVIRNSKPVFRIVPPEEGGSLVKRRTMSLNDITARFDKAGAGDLISPRELDEIIHEVHSREREE